MLPEIPTCSVCMEGAGDVIVLPCLHGGICEVCAEFILENKAVGGQRCPVCREEIRRLGRLASVSLINGIVAAELDPPKSVNNQPPKVPPPPGSRKKNH